MVRKATDYDLPRDFDAMSDDEKCQWARREEEKGNLRTSTNDDTGEWAIVEIFGHRRHAGRISEIQRFGATLLRIDEPVVAWDGEDDDAKPVITGWKTHDYGGAAVFSCTHVDEATVLQTNAPYRYRRAVPASLPAPEEADFEEEDYDG